MAEETGAPPAGGERQERRSGEDRRNGEDRRKESRGARNLPLLRSLLDRRKGGERRSGKDRRQS